jgi:hypothetical protein
MYLWTDAFAAGRWDEAQQLADDCLAGCLASGGAVYAQIAKYHTAILAGVRGDQEKVDALTGELAHWATSHGTRQTHIFAWHATGRHGARRLRNRLPERRRNQPCGYFRPLRAARTVGLSGSCRGSRRHQPRRRRASTRRRHEPAPACRYLTPASSCHEQLRDGELIAGLVAAVAAASGTVGDPCSAPSTALVVGGSTAAAMVRVPWSTRPVSSTRSTVPSSCTTRVQRGGLDLRPLTRPRRGHRAERPVGLAGQRPAGAGRADGVPARGQPSRQPVEGPLGRHHRPVPGLAGFGQDLLDPAA